MASYSKVLLSGSTNGKPVKVVATGTLGTTIHTAVSGTSSIDEIWLWVTNTHTSAVALTIEYGGATDPDCLSPKTYSVPANSPPLLIWGGLPLQNALVVTAFADVASKLLITGYVNRIS